MNVGRIAVLALALGAGGFAALLVARQDSGSAPESPPPAPQIATTDVLVATADIGIGNKLAAADVRWQIWPEASAGPFIRKADDPDAIGHLTGAIARASFSAGEPIGESKLIRADGAGYMAAILPSGRRAESVEISPESGAGGFILPNDRVDVILTARDSVAQKNSIEAYRVETVLTNVRVLAIDQTVEEKSGQRVVVGRTATLDVSPAEAERLALARREGQLSLALRSIADVGEKKLPVLAQATPAPVVPPSPPDYTISVYRGASDVPKRVSCNPWCGTDTRDKSTDDAGRQASQP
jgi:pilus assembly protein CpaB